MKSKNLKSLNFMHKPMAYLFPIALCLVLFSSCKNETIDIQKERQNAVEEYVSNMESKKEQKLAVIKKFYSVFSTGDMSVLPEILAANYTQYPSDPGQTPDIKGFIKHAQDFGSMFSDLKGKPSHILVDKDFVFVRSELDLLHSGAAFDIPATNKRITVNAFDLHHFNAEGKIDKTWHLEDFYGAYSQISSK